MPETRHPPFSLTNKGITMSDVAVIILAAGKGTRMQSDLAKVLHPVAGKTMVNHVIDAASAVAPESIHVVVGHQAEAVKKEVLKTHCVHFALQQELIGTGDAVKVALPGLDNSISTILVLCGDVPLIQSTTLVDLIEAHKTVQARLTVLGVQVDSPEGYGRIIQNKEGKLLAIREEADADESEKSICLVNSGIYCFDRNFLEAGVRRIGNNNNQAEYYLTDLVEIAVKQGDETHVFITRDHRQVIGVNSPEQLVLTERLYREMQDELP